MITPDPVPPLRPLPTWIWTVTGSRFWATASTLSTADLSEATTWLMTGASPPPEVPVARIRPAPTSPPTRLATRATTTRTGLVRGRRGSGAGGGVPQAGWCGDGCCWAAQPPGAGATGGGAPAPGPGGGCWAPVQGAGRGCSPDG